MNFYTDNIVGRCNAAINIVQNINRLSLHAAIANGAAKRYERRKGKCHRHIKGPQSYARA